MKRLFFLLLLALPLVLVAQTKSVPKPDRSTFCEYTREFFSTPNSYSVSMYILVSIRDTHYYEDGEASFSVTSDGFTIRWQDGRSESCKITNNLQKVPIISIYGDIELPMYILDDGIGIRVVKFNDGSYTVYRYVLNIPSGKYDNTDLFQLKKLAPKYKIPDTEVPLNTFDLY